MKKWVIFSFLILLSTACAGTGSRDSQVSEIGRSERFVAYDNGTVKDLTTGHEDWRMPTGEELKAIYNPRITNPHPLSEGCEGVCHITRFIHLSCCPVWSWDGIVEVETFFHFGRGPGDWRDQSLSTNHPRALPVRDDG